MKVHHSLATYHGGAADMNKRCAMWLPTFLQRGIHFFGERTEVLAFNNFVLFDRVHLPIIGKRAAVIEEDLLSVREPVRAKTGAALPQSAMRYRSACCGISMLLRLSLMRSSISVRIRQSSASSARSRRTSQRAIS
jgi:hypothetical protein